MTAAKHRSGRAPQRPAPTDLTAPRPTGIRWRAAVLALAVVVTYANSLSGPFVLDDQASIVQNPQIRNLSRLGGVLLPAAQSPVAGRPVPSLSFAINYAIGGLEVRGYHVVNIVLHLVCALLAFGILRRTFEMGRLKAAPTFETAASTHETGRAKAAPTHAGLDLAFAAALLWAVHPLNSEVVDYLTQRTESLMAACYLGTMYLAIRAITGRKPVTWQWLAVLSCVVGMTCKESMVTAPLMVVLYDRVIVFESWRAAFARRKWLYAGLCASWLVLAALIASAPREGIAGFSTGVSGWTYLLNQAVMITEYLRLSLWPRALVVFYGWPLPLTVGDVIPYLALITLLLAVTVLALVRAPALGFIGAWFFITLSPSSSFVPVATEVGAERRMYLPLLAVAVLAVVASHVAWMRAGRAFAAKGVTSSRALATIPIVVLILASGALAAATVARNRDYASALTLTRTVVERRPTGVAHHMLGEQLMLAGKDEEAGRQFREAVGKGNSRAGFQLGLALYNQGKLPEAVERFEAFVRSSQSPHPLVPRWLEPPVTEVVQARLAMGRAFVLQSAWSKAAEQAQAVLAVAPGHVGARELLADVFFGQQQWDAAAAQYRQYLSARPTDGRALINFGIARVAVGNLDEAIAAFARAVQVDPGDARAKRLLGLARADQARLAAQTP